MRRDTQSSSLLACNDGKTVKKWMKKQIWAVNLEKQLQTIKEL